MRLGSGRIAALLLLAGAQGACIHFGNGGNDDAGADVAGDGGVGDAREAGAGEGGDAAPGVDATCYGDAGDAPALSDFDAGNSYYPDGSAGTRDRLEFVYESGDLFVTFPMRPMLVGTRETITGFRNDLLPRLGASVADPTVVTAGAATVTRYCCSDTDAGASCTQLPDTPPACMDCSGRRYSFVSVPLTALAAGDTTLTLRAEDGSEYDTIALSVRPAASLRVYQAVLFGDAQEITSLSAAVGDTPRLQARAYGADGAQLEARFGITVTSSDASLATVRVHTLGAGGFMPSVDSYDVDLYAAAAGDVNLTFTATQATATLPVQIR